MRRIALVIAAGVVFVAVAGCAPQPAAPPAAPATESAVEASRAVGTGESVAMANGLTVTVPAGWTATYTRYSAPGSSDPLRADESVVLGREGAGGTAMLFSSSAATLSPKALGQFAADTLTRVRSSSSITIYKGARPFGVGRSLYVASTQLPGAALGAVYFGGPSSDVTEAVRAAWSLLGIRGVTVP